MEPSSSDNAVERRDRVSDLKLSVSLIITEHLQRYPRDRAGARTPLSYTRLRLIQRRVVHVRPQMKSREYQSKSLYARLRYWHCRAFSPVIKAMAAVAH